MSSQSTVRAGIALIAVLLAAGAVASCASSKNALSAPAQQAMRIDAFVQGLQEQLNRRDHAGLLALTAPPLSDDPAFAKNLRALIDQTNAIDATFVIERLWQVSAESTRVDLHWTLRIESAADRSASGPANESTATGSARFTITGKETPRLTTVAGDNPFILQPSRPLP